MRARAELKGQQTTAMEDHKPSASAGEREGKGEGATAMREAVSDSEDEPLFVPSTATSKRSKAAADSALLASCSASSLLHIPKRVKPGIAPVSGAGEVEAASNVADGADDSDDNLFGQRAARKAAAISTPSATTSASTDQATPPVVALPPPLPTPPAPVLHRPSHRRHVSDSEVDYDDESESSEEGERGRYSSASSSTGTYYSDSASSDAQTNSGSEEGSESGGSSGSSIISGSVSGGGSASAGSALPMEGSDGEEGEEEWDENEEEGEEDWEGEEGDWGEEQGEEEAPPANATHVLLPPVGWTPAAMGGQTESFGGGDEAGLAAVEGGFEVEDEWLRAADMDHARSRCVEGCVCVAVQLLSQFYLKRIYGYTFYPLAHHES